MPEKDGCVLRLHGVRDGVTKLGTGVRYAVWTQGCKKRCRGCMTPESRDMNGGYEMSASELARNIISSGREGVTISGGEPFLQARALASAIELVKKERDIGVIIYTGYTLEELRATGDSYVLRLLELCDLLVDGEYIDELNDGMNLRGSSNQRALALTERYAQSAAEYGTKKAEFELFWGAEKISIVGIPPKDMLERFKNIEF
ncbi:MAG: radical SAM protein [Clostridia bacterium]|nr:radical SAM protein [Clostridia bacterium]